jgi:hypothetical protein
MKCPILANLRPETPKRARDKRQTLHVFQQSKTIHRKEDRKRRRKQNPKDPNKRKLDR